MNISNPATRKWIYGIAAAAMPLLVLVGAITDEASVSILNVIAAILSVGASSLAYANVPGQEDVSE